MGLQNMECLCSVSGIQVIAWVKEIPQAGSVNEMVLNLLRDTYLWLILSVATSCLSEQVPEVPSCLGVLGIKSTG